MDTLPLEDLILKTSENPSAANCKALLARLAEAGNPLPADDAARLELLWEAKPWSGEISPEIAGFVLGVAALGGCDNALYRKLLAGAVKRSLPPYLAYPPVLRALGVRDTKRPAPEVALRLKRLMLIKNGTVIYLPDSARWGVAGTVDGINGTLPVSSFSGRGSSASLPLESVLGNVVMLSPGTELSRLVLAGASPLASPLFRAMVERHALEPVPAEVMREMARTGCAAALDGSRFESYWKQQESAAAPAAPAAGGRVSSAGRSLKEIDVLLAAEKAAGEPPAYTENDFLGLEAFFRRMRPETAARETKLLAQVVAGIAERTSEADLPRLQGIVAGKLPFWPAVPARATYADLAVWGALPVKVMESLVRFGTAVSGQEYLAALAVRLPLKALNCLAPRIAPEALFRALASGRGCGADVMVWTWKNHKKLAGTELVGLLTADNVLRTLATEDPPKEWGAARRELRQLLMDNADFQGALIVSAGSVEALTTVLSSALFLSAGERQSLIVKLARISPEFLSHLEHGAGRKILDSAGGEQPGAPEVSAHLSSLRSQSRMKAELDDIINVQIPENREALKVARAHGDFRENAEFDAAKERRNELTRRRNELERELERFQTVTMAEVKVDDAAVIGSEIELAYSDGKQETYWLLGAWDGDPARHFLSYRARLGAAVLNKRVGDEFDAPGNRRAKLVAVRPLPAEIVAELDRE